MYMTHAATLNYKLAFTSNPGSPLKVFRHSYCNCPLPACSAYNVRESWVQGMEESQASVFDRSRWLHVALMARGHITIRGLHKQKDSIFLLLCPVTPVLALTTETFQRWNSRALLLPPAYTTTQYFTNLAYGQGRRPLQYIASPHLSWFKAGSLIPDLLCNRVLQNSGHLVGGEVQPNCGATPAMKLSSPSHHRSYPQASIDTQNSYSSSQ